MTRVPKIINNALTKYDKSHDVLHVFFFPELLSVDDEEFPGVVIRRAVSDNRITGITILDFSRKDEDLLNNLLPEFDFSGLHKQIMQ
ncbi:MULTISPECIES: DUF2283 domain-containing protein [Geobacillus]|uniref:DUF2283 domain-containing protein n=1 Tax=Geobacillus TaxID=129337 RepID=UPI000649398E|nr:MULTISPECIES: DUF2283 domain-containing protein [Geobacillus]KLR75308.1 hypothetical protein ABH20_01045 [Geobacillus sp. T6]MBW7642459.1 DUF2283 domain-containing protein [Geobacillus thermoleovorans]MED3719520.1 DUF2283 domain-containing protein [Geobacillus stearothermophilus]WJQ14541.1 DUF2283 domain-containing protein [Geobacillus stearothermophilus]